MTFGSPNQSWTRTKGGITHFIHSACSLSLSLSLSLSKMEEQSSSTQPLLSPGKYQLTKSSTSLSSSSSFIADEADIKPVGSVRDFFREFSLESKKLWYLAAPAIFTTVCQYSLGAITQVFAGHVGTVELAAVSVENSVIAGFSFGLLLGMGSALETLCGQAVGAGQLDMLGIYMQRSWVILGTTSFFLMFFYIFATPLLKLIGQTTEISEAAGTFAVWMIPQLFAYAFMFPQAKFLQAQSKMAAMAVIGAAALVLHTVFSWLLMLKLGWGLVGAAMVLNSTWWLIVVAQMLYIVCGSCDRAWSGFSWMAFHNLWGFAKLSLASAVMLCLETWYFMALILFAGYLKNAEVAVDGLSICMNLLGWTIMVALGFNAAISVRVSNELGAAHPRAAKFSVVVATVTSMLVGLAMALVLIIARKQYPDLFSRVAIGAGWQAYVAYVNIGCYYFFGIPLGLLLGYATDMGVTGIWDGMLTGTVLQTCILLWMIYRTNWNKEASIAGRRIKEWGGKVDLPKDTDAEKEGIK
ncbi:hypothetical protein RHMOL_Rhmol12G0130600 [Rhododendron molle]|uniref:Uncharacterized protein n=1 Tax=Rhododendron molle TaxID=49168 RepID=A0ACC0LIN2_RHOML|nr:hypothetical protein RHMOL_Rhmol12G0130600 [Rhododendron molle]